VERPVRAPSIADATPCLRARPSNDAWRDHLALKRQWLAEEPGSFVLGAELNGRLVGYAFVRIVAEKLAVSWTISNPYADWPQMLALNLASVRELSPLDAQSDRIAALTIRQSPSALTRPVARPRLAARRAAM